MIMQNLERREYKKVYVSDISDTRKIQYAFEKLLYVPDKELKPRIIKVLIQYLTDKLNNYSYPLKLFIAKQGRIITGVVVCQIDPEYRSYSRKCGTFGWLYAHNFESCKALMSRCELLMREHKIRKLRGPINYPKLIGGIGFQIKGFEEKMMGGVNYHHPNIRELKFLDQLGYERESKYSCVLVTQDNWKKGNEVDNSIKIGYKTIEEFKNLFDEIRSLVKKSFHSVLADAPGGRNRLEEMAYLFSLVPKSHYKLSDNFNPEDWTDIPAFIETLNSSNLENVITWMPMAFDRETDELVGLIISLPNLYQIWKEQPLTDDNVDTVIISKKHTGKGIFSILNNIGRVVLKINGIEYVEGTTIWSNNDRAIKTIFPHSKPIREYLVMQKRLRA